MAFVFGPHELFPTGFSTEFGIPAHTYTEEADQAQYRISERGLALLEEPGFQALVSQALLLDPADVSTHGSLHPLKIARDPDQTKGLVSTGSVFESDGYIVKHGRNPQEAHMQFGFMNLLSQRLQTHGNQVDAPAQHLLVQGRGGSVLVMERKPGGQVQTLLHETQRTVASQRSAKEASTLTTELGEMVRQIVWGEVAEAIGKTTARSLLNDLSGRRSDLGNILVSGVSAEYLATSGDFPANTKFTIIDQPSVLTKKDKLLLPRMYALLAGKK